MDKLIEQLKKFYAQRKDLDKKISVLETKLIGSAKTAVKKASSKVSMAKKTVRRARGKTVRKR